MTIRPIDKYIDKRYYQNMVDLTQRQGVELFHLLFLEHFGRNIDKALYALKGGCNLRFFLLSPRYSEDIDLDIHTIEKSTLQKKMERILRGMPFNIALKAKGISLTDYSAPKQTPTTQRWKIQLVIGKGILSHTKIEFSRREKPAHTIFEPINRELAFTYQIPPLMANHYSKEEAFSQKISALLGRPTTQARDLFDLYHLIQCKTDVSQISIDQLQEKRLLDIISGISYEDYCSLVVAFLPDDQQEIYQSVEVWERMVFQVIEAISP
jgi:predicted nucleotidyltransferase component of viral defense system